MQKLTKNEKEFFLWICRETDLSIWYIINNYKNIYPLEVLFMLLSLFDKGYLIGHDYREKVIPNVSMVSLTEDGKSFFEEVNPEEYREKEYYWESCNKKRKDENDVVVSSVELEKLFVEQGYTIEWENEYTLVIRQGFSRYYIYKTPVSIFIEKYYLEQIVRKTHSILLVVPNDLIKRIAIKGVSEWIQNCFGDIRNFLEEGNAYSVITINELKNTPLFPRYIPENSHQHY